MTMLIERLHNDCEAAVTPHDLGLPPSAADLRKMRQLEGEAMDALQRLVRAAPRLSKGAGAPPSWVAAERRPYNRHSGLRRNL